jgi:3-oxoacyl-[acyl-carrier-protein] synthase-3
MQEEKVGILGLGAYVPERIMTNEDWSELVETSDEWITKRTGIKTRRIAAKDQSTLDLAEQAALEALKDANLSPEDIDELVVATDTPEVYAPDTASYLQHRLGLRNVASYDLAGSGCAGFLQALDVAKCRVNEDRKRILVVGVELLTRLMNWEDRDTCVLFGDAAGAAVLSQGEGVSEILSTGAGTDGSKADILCLETGGTRHPFSLEAAERGDHYAVVMKGREVFKHAVHRMCEISSIVLSKAGASIDEVKLVIPHQANLRILEAVSNVMNLKEDQMYVNVDKYGNTGSASVPLALVQARQEGRFGKGDLVLLTSFGAGLHWASVLVKF